MNNNLNAKIIESYTEIDKIQNDIKNKMLNFINKANELVELSDNDYQIEKTLMLNKISLKGYVLDSDCCVQLNKKNITDYSTDELKKYLVEYDELSNNDYSNYLLALSLYELIEDIENQVDLRNNLEINILLDIIPNINDIKNLSKDKYENYYYDFKKQLYDFFVEKKLDENAYNVCIQIVNDIFNYYISGYPIIPDEYLYQEE